VSPRQIDYMPVRAYNILRIILRYIYVLKGVTMPAILPVSDLRNYNDVLNEVAPENPVFLTRNGRGRYVVEDINDYENLRAELRLLSNLESGVRSGREKGWLTLDEVKKSVADARG
jgi:prevent-host-death family protein